MVKLRWKSASCTDRALQLMDVTLKRLEEEEKDADKKGDDGQGKKDSAWPWMPSEYFCCFDPGAPVFISSVYTVRSMSFNLTYSACRSPDAVTKSAAYNSLGWVQGRTCNVRHE
uniref:Uncharacterized protein n=1 Tax=Neospora caninum (strain Liverpool) TaxID=572307 RepID=A0A0F7UAB3_NEOCL|nr:TPA: hypothetical protein BN1204_011925 [Neospora caninum Liverpool]